MPKLKINLLDFSSISAIVIGFFFNFSNMKYLKNWLQKCNFIKNYILIKKHTSSIII